MDLTKQYYRISKDTIEKCLEALGNNWFDGDYNNNDIIKADEALQEEIEKQQKL